MQFWNMNKPGGSSDIMCLTSWLVLFIDDMNLNLVDLWRFW